MFTVADGEVSFYGDAPAGQCLLFFVLGLGFRVCGEGVFGATPASQFSGFVLQCEVSAGRASGVCRFACWLRFLRWGLVRL